SDDDFLNPYDADSEGSDGGDVAAVSSSKKRTSERTSERTSKKAKIDP
ncbi:hypothetical protein A2U01_0066152, partial [Trifolium medium]|nr:hypothetical protein [Trifolium medium]